MNALGSRRRMLLALALCLGLVALLTSPSPSQAQLGRCGNEFYYYSDATETELVGYEVYDCNCFHSFWGVRTVYREIVPLEYC